MTGFGRYLDALRRKAAHLYVSERARLVPGVPGMFALGLGGIAIPEFYHSARAHHSAAQSVDALTWTDVSLNTERWDNAGLHDTATNPHRMTVSRPGVYMFFFQDTWASNATGLRAGQLRYNGDGGTGGTLVMSVGLDAIAYASALSPVWFATLWNMAADGDYMSHSVLQDISGGGALNLNAVEYGCLGPLPVGSL